MAEIAAVPDLTSLYDALGHRFSSVEPLVTALTHRSWTAENPESEQNERLEFLGDAVLGLAVTENLYQRQPNHVEGDLAKARAEVVSAPALAQVARQLGLGPMVRLGRGEELSGGCDKESILADAMEAVLGAVYLDAGWPAVRDVIDRLFFEIIDQAQTGPGVRDHKTRLQELAAELSVAAPDYDTRWSGPDHGRQFTSTVSVGGVVGRGSGTSKKQAQQQAAEDALNQLKRRAS